MWALDLPRAGARRVHAMARSSGAGESGLADLVGLHSLHSMGDALVTAALAGTLFFSVPVGQARGRVALYLLLTMAPFAVVAPVIGPVLDRLRRGRRLALGGSMLLRAVLAVGMARWYSSIELYPAAFGVLVLSKTYTVARGAVVPRLLPPQITLVAANARLTVASLVVGSIAAPVGLGLGHLLGPTWPLGLAAAVFLGATAAALRLPSRVDVHDDEPPVGRVGARPARPAAVAETAPLPVARTVGAAVFSALRAAAALRAFVGFLTMFLAFLLRAQGAGNAGIGLLALVAATGSFAGTWTGARLPERVPESLLTAVLALSTAAVAAGAWFFTVASALGVAFVGTFAAGLGKLAVDAVIQRDTAEEIRASAFARSETVLQLAWVVGGGVGIALPLQGALGFGTATVGLGLALGLTLRSRHRQRSLLPVSGRNQRAGTPEQRTR